MLRLNEGTRALLKGVKVRGRAQCQLGLPSLQLLTYIQATEHFRIKSLLSVTATWGQYTLYMDAILQSLVRPFSFISA
jgi:hypothetical protein